MKTYFFSVPLLVATAVFLGYLLGDRLFRHGPRGWRRRLAWLLLLAGMLGLSAILFAHEQISHFRQSLRSFDRLPQAEMCSDSPGHNRAQNGMHDFEAWAKQVRAMQGGEKGALAARAFSTPSGETCELRYPDEPWLHYRYRRLIRHFRRSKSEAPESVPSLVQRLEARFKPETAQVSQFFGSELLEPLPHFFHRSAAKLAEGSCQKILSKGACLVRGRPGESLIGQVYEEGKQEGLRLLRVPEDYFSEAKSEIRSFRLLRFSYELARLVQPSFHIQVSAEALPGDEALESRRLRLLLGAGFGLTRLNALAFFSPFSDREPPLEVQNRMRWLSFNTQMNALQSQLRHNVGIPKELSPFDGGTAGELAATLSGYLKLPTSPRILQLESEIAEISLNGCDSSSTLDRLECVIASVQELCGSEKSVTREECLAWGDIAAAQLQARGSIFDSADRYRYRAVSALSRSELTRKILNEKAWALARDFKQVYAVEGAEQLANFCFQYSRFRPLPPFACVALVLRGRFVSIQEP